MEDDVIKLLAGANPKKAQDFVLAFGEQRTAAWADSHRQAVLKSASERHIPHFRGQLRHQLGEAALARAAESANLGCIPFRTVKPGGVFMIARVGRFGLVNLSVAGKRCMPRKSVTRRLLSQPNDDIDPQTKLLLANQPSSRGATELAYFGCMVACPLYGDPRHPSQMVFAVPNARLTEWLHWISFTQLYALLQNAEGEGDVRDRSAETKPIQDRRIPKFRLPKQDRETGDGSNK